MSETPGGPTSVPTSLPLRIRPDLGRGAVAGRSPQPAGPSVHSRQGPCPLVLDSQLGRQMGLSENGKGNGPASWAPRHPGCGSELALPRGPHGAWLHVPRQEGSLP